MENLLDVGDGFLVRFPVLLFMKIGPSFLIEGHHGARQCDDGTMAVPMFTDEHLADSFEDGRPRAMYPLVSITSPFALLGLLMAIHKLGVCTHVSFDPSEERAPFRYSIADLQSRILDRLISGPPAA